MSSEIRSGERFRREIQRRIRKADLIIAIFPSRPSHWLTAEAGLAYFEEKLLPVALDKAHVVEPFSELQVHTLSNEDIAKGYGASIDGLIHLVRTRLGHNAEYPRLIALFRFLNSVFLRGVPILGVSFLTFLIVATLPRTLVDHSIEYWKAGHIVLGAIVYGGAAFVTLVSSAVGTSSSLAERQFAGLISRHLFYIWSCAAILQFGLGFALVGAHDGWALSTDWIALAIIYYVLAILMIVVGFVCHQFSANAGETDFITGLMDIYTFVGNITFGFGLLFLTCVVILMGLKERVVSILSFWWVIKLFS
jgi:uncharacterized membrane protein